MPPPSSNLLKRKTLAERAGETARPAPAPPSSRHANAYVRTTSIAGAARDASFSSSVSSSRPTSSASTRNLSNSSYGSSVGSGVRPPSSQSYRPQSAMSYPRIQRPFGASDRPATSLEVHEEEPRTGRTVNKRKGRTPISLNPQDWSHSLRTPKTRRINGVKANCTTDWENTPFRTVSLRDVSISTKLQNFHLGGEASQPAPIAEARERSVSPVSRAAPIADLGVPKTPSHIPKLAPRNALPAECPSPTKSPKKTPKPLPMFLTRDSNTTSAFDTEGRLEEVENMCSQFKEKMDGATTESKGLKEMMGMYKVRSTFPKEMSPS